MPQDKSATVADEFDRMRGRILGLIESWGLPDKQERGCKQTFKSLTFDSQKVIKELIEDPA